MTLLKRLFLISGAVIIGCFVVIAVYLLSLRVSPPPLNGEMRHIELNVDGNRREYHYYLTDKLADNAPIVFVLHGSGMNGESTRAVYGYRFDELADKHGFIPVYPTGFENHWNDCRAGADYEANLQDIDDIAFFEAIVADLVSRHDADRQRVFVTGLSNGGHMAYKLALEAPNLVTAVAPVAANLPVWDESDCEPSGVPVSVAIMNGTEDPVNPYPGGVVSIFGNTSRGTVMASMESAEYFAALAGYQKETEVRSLPDVDPEDDSTIELTSWAESGLPLVRHYGVIGGGHTVPSKIAEMPEFLVGPTNRDIEGADELWAYFQSVEARIEK